MHVCHGISCDQIETSGSYQYSVGNRQLRLPDLDIAPYLRSVEGKLTAFLAPLSPRNSRLSFANCSADVSSCWRSIPFLHPSCGVKLLEEKDGGDVNPRVLALVALFALVTEAAAQDSAVDAGIQLSPQCEAIRNQYQQSLDHALQQRASTIKNGYPTQDIDASIAFYRKAIVEVPTKCERVRAETLASQSEQKADEERAIREAEADIRRESDEEDRAAGQRAKARARCTPPSHTVLRQVDAAMTCLGKAITVLGRNEVKTSEGSLVMMKSENGTGLFLSLIHISEPTRPY